MLRIYYNDALTKSDEDLLSHFRGKALQSPTRSTVPLLDMALNVPTQLLSIVDECGAEPNSDFRFEYEVRSGSETARPSQTDLMVLGRSSALAVEAKWTEPVYESVATRLKRRTKDRKDDQSEQAKALDRAHQEAEVGAWLARLQPLAAEPLTTVSMADVVYQMIHRAASALATGLSPSLLYLHFHDAEIRQGATADQYKTDLGRLYRKLGRPLGFSFYVATQPIERTEVFRSIEGLSKTHSSTCIAVREALKAGPLFTFGTARVEKID